MRNAYSALAASILLFTSTPSRAQPPNDKPVAPGELRCFQLYDGDAACFYNAPSDGPVNFTVLAEVTRKNGDVDPKGGLWMAFGIKDATVKKGKFKWQPGLKQCDFVANPSWDGNNSMPIKGSCLRYLKKGIVYEFEAIAGVDPGGSGYVKASNIKISEKK